MNFCFFPLPFLLPFIALCFLSLYIYFSGDILSNLFTLPFWLEPIKYE
jgi:hypothetical protein